MNNFKIQTIALAANSDIRTIRIPTLPRISLPLQTITLQAYQVGQLLQVIGRYLAGEGDRKLLIKALKVMGASMGDGKLWGGLEKILLTEEKSRVYELLVLWAQAGANLVNIMLKMSSHIRNQLLIILITYFFLRSHHPDIKLARQLPQIIAIGDISGLGKALNWGYTEQGQPLKLVISKCKLVNTQSSDMMGFMRGLLQWAVESSEAKVLEIVQNIQQNQESLDYLIKLLPNMASIIVKQLKKTINQENLLQPCLIKSQFGSLLKIAVKEWLQEGHNFWKAVDKYFEGSYDKRIQVIEWGRLLAKENVVNFCISIKYLYQYFTGKYIDFDQEDKFVLLRQTHQSWTDTYKSISQCSSFQSFNLIALNVNSAVKHWQCCNPFKLQIKNKVLCKLVQKYRQFYEETQKQYLGKNKRLQLAYSTLLIKSKGGKYFWISFYQLKAYLQQGTQLNQTNFNFKQQYKPFEQQIKVKQEIKKEHNIVVQAKLVRLLKRSKSSVNINWLSKESGYEIGVVEMGLKRLCNKGIAQLDSANQNYSYVP